MADNPGYIHDKKGSRSDGQGINSGSGTSIDSGNTSARDGSAQCVGSQEPFPGIPLPKNAESSFEMTIPPVEVPPDTTPDHSGGGQLLYTITDTPPWYLCVLLGLQHYLTMVGATITLPFILTPLFCMMDNNPARGEILSTIFFVCGIVTFLQVTFGVRLPIVQGGTFAFLVPTIAILSTSFPACDFAAIGNMTAADEREEWQMRIREVQGAIAVSSLFQILIGFTGLIGLVVTFITPLAIAPTISLVGLALFETASSKAATNWGIASLTIGLLILFSQYLESYSIPFPIYKRNSGCSFVKLRIFGLMPVLLSILLSWALCAILTAADALPEGSAARTDTAGQLIANSPWFRVPYPGQWGLPTVSVAGIFGMMAGVLASIVESVGDYYACARLSGAPPPPRHAINRGIGVEGIGCLIAGLWGTGNGTTSYSENIGAIGITKVGSRRVIQYGAGIMIICGVLGKFAAVFVTIPAPVVGGIFCVMFAMITAVGLSSLQFIDLNSARNLFVLGFSIFFGLALSKWMEANPGAVQTGSDTFDQIITVLLQTSMFVGGFLGILLDNTIPGTPHERGLTKWRGKLHGEDGSMDNKGIYDFPFGMAAVRRNNWTRYVPVCPTFTGWRFRSPRADA